MEEQRGAPAPTLTVREARDAYLRRNGFTTDAYEAPKFSFVIGGITWSLPNYAARRRMIPLHDLHHVATGYDTDLAGESEQSAWELRAGIRGWFLWWFKLSAIAIGCVICPRRVLRAFRKARGQRTLYVQNVRYDELLDRSVGELREELLGMPRAGQREHE